MLVEEFVDGDGGGAQTDEGSVVEEGEEGGVADEFRGGGVLFDGGLEVLDVDEGCGEGEEVAQGQNVGGEFAVRVVEDVRLLDLIAEKSRKQEDAGGEGEACKQAACAVALRGGHFLSLRRMVSRAAVAMSSLLRRSMVSAVSGFALAVRLGRLPPGVAPCGSSAMPQSQSMVTPRAAARRERASAEGMAFPLR